jgi:hypothetical protein
MDAARSTRAACVRPGPGRIVVGGIRTPRWTWSTSCSSACWRAHRRMLFGSTTPSAERTPRSTRRPKLSECVHPRPPTRPSRPASCSNKSGSIARRRGSVRGALAKNATRGQNRCPKPILLVRLLRTTIEYPVGHAAPCDHIGDRCGTCVRGGMPRRHRRHRRGFGQRRERGWQRGKRRRRRRRLARWLGRRRFGGCDGGHRGQRRGGWQRRRGTELEPLQLRHEHRRVVRPNAAQCAQRHRRAVASSRL